MPAPPTPVHSLLEQWQGLVTETAAGDGGTVSAWFGGLDGSAFATRDEDAVHYAASTMKLPLVATAYRLAERGRLDLDAAVPVHNRFASAADGSPFSLDPDDDQDPETWEAIGTSRSLRRLARQSIVRSGNLATNLLLEQVGTGPVAELLSDAGCSPRTTVRRGIEDAAARRAGIDNVVTARDLARVLVALGGRSLAAPPTCEAVERVLSGQQHRDGVPAGVPEGTYVANKTGWVDGVTHDAALVRPADAAPYVLVVCTSADLSEDRAHRLIADLSAVVWEARPR